jgi:hypothetical protein
MNYSTPSEKLSARLTSPCYRYTKVTEAGGPLTPVRPAAYEAAARTPRAAARPFGFDVAARRQAGPPYNIDTTYYSQVRTSPPIPP